MDNVVIGQYIPGKSIIHKLDPRIKISILILLIVTIFVAPTLLSEVILLTMSIFFVVLSGIPLRKVFRGLKGLLFLLCFTAVLQIGYTTTGSLWIKPIKMNMTVFNIIIAFALLFIFLFTKRFMKFKFIYFLILLVISLALQYHFVNGPTCFTYRIRIYEGGVIRSGFIIIRIVNLVILSSLLTFTTSSIDLNNGLESLLKPLKYIRVPVSEIAMMLSLVLRFIPTLLNETNKIIKAQASRGVDFKESNLKQKINQVISLLVPMFVVSFKRADDLANAMESRGYVIGEERTKIDIMQVKQKDIVSLVLVFVLLGITIWSSIVLWE